MESYPDLLSLRSDSESAVTSCKLLLAEDDEAGALYAEAVLRACGCDVRRASDGVHALALDFRIPMPAYAARFSWAASQARSNCIGLT